MTIDEAILEQLIEIDNFDLIDYYCMKFVVVDRCIVVVDIAIDHFVVDIDD